LVIIAGWLCTGFLVAGSGTGFAHTASGLFSEVVRIVRASKPSLVSPENSRVMSKFENLKIVEDAFDGLEYDLRSAFRRSRARVCFVV
jgi:site-specific DNA-cytosine methylase